MTTAAIQHQKLTDDDKYDELVYAACTRVASTQEHVLQFYWDLGHIVRKATDGKDGQSVPQFLAHMTQAMPGHIHLQVDALYDTINMTKYTPAQLDLAKQCHVPLRHALSIATQPSERITELLKMVETKEIKPQELNAAAKKTGGSDGSAPLDAQVAANNPERKEPVDSKRAATIKFTRLVKVIDLALEKMSGYADALDILCSVMPDDSEKEKLRISFRDTVARMKDFELQWEKESKLAMRVMGKTITLGEVAVDL